MKYYAEFETDRIIREKYFPDYNYKGLIVEVGGGTPEFLSMSKHFKDNGWRTIIFEPNPKFAQLHRDAGNAVFELACSNEDKDDCEFTIVEQNVNWLNGTVTDHAFSSIGIKNSYLQKTNFKINELNSKKIYTNIRRLDTVLSKINVNKIDILSIDVEGWEIEVMQGLDTKKIECTLIVIENFLHDKFYNSYLNSIGYYLADQIEHNYIFMKNNV